MRYLLTILTICFCFVLADAQLVNYTAKDTITPYTDYFRPGVNMGYFPPYGDNDLANIAAGNPALGIPGAGVKVMRPGLYDSFTAVWGIDSRVSTYEHFVNLGMKDMTCIVGFPAEWHREHWSYCDNGIESEMFANIYTDIWDNGENGTPYNDENYYAAYLYEVVSNYKDHIKFWEIWNEPGLDYTGAKGWLPPGAPGNWWDNDPDPCDYKLRAPIQYYIRTLRISWEIIKTLDPDAYVVVAGVGFPAFLDAVLRNTDNIDGGKVSPEFPHAGGAYFDVMGFHSYPDIDGSVRYWSNEIFDFVYTRHSDAAVSGIKTRKDTYQGVLDKYGYDGSTYPKKEWIITEINVPRKAFNPNSMGNQEAQLNYILKTLVKAMENDIRQMHVYNLIDIDTEENADYEYDLMGLYKNIDGQAPYSSLEINPEGIAYKTGSDILFGTRYDRTRSAAMLMGNDIDGGAFRNEDGTYTYVLWAKAKEDRSEDVSEMYSFPPTWNVPSLERKVWDHAQTGVSTTIDAQNIQLTARPIFLTENEVSLVPLTAGFSTNVDSGCGPLTVSFSDASIPNVTSWEWSFPGGTPATSTAQNPQVVYQTPGTYDVALVIGNGTENASITQAATIEVLDSPTANFTASNNLLELSLTNTSTNTSSYLWDFGDGTTSNEFSPTHTYAEDGTYTVTLVSSSSCGSIEVSEVVEIQSIFTPVAAFSSSAVSGCAPLEVQFTDASTNNPNNWQWIVSGASPSITTEQNPTITFETAGTYTVILQASNSAGTDILIQEQQIEVFNPPTASFTVDLDGASVLISNNSTNTTDYLWDFGDGTTSTEENPNHTYTSGGTYTIMLTSENDCATSIETQEIEVMIASAPQANFTADVNTGCAPLEVQFSDASLSQPTSWSWLFEGGTPATSTEQNPIVSYTEAGSYKVTLFVSNAIGNDVIEQTSLIEVQEEPYSIFASFIQNGEVSFNNFSNENATYSWDFGDGASSNEQFPIHIYTENGTYPVTLVVENMCGVASSTREVTITGAAAPQAVFSFDVNTGCAPLEVQFTDESVSNPDSWLWIFEGGTPATSTEQNPSVSYTEAGVYEVTLSVSNDIGSDIAAQMTMIEVLDNPVAEFSTIISNNSVIFNNLSSANATYIWDFGDGTTSEEASPTHDYTQDGTYDVHLVVTNLCGSTTFTETVNIVGSNAPQAAFAFDINSGCMPLTVQFDDQSSLSPTSWSWLFPGGEPSMSNEENPTVTYAEAGSYEVTLSVSNGAGNDVLTLSNLIEVYGMPDATFEHTIFGDSVAFSQAAQGATSWIWNFGDGTSSDEENPSHVYSDIGTYDVSVTITNDCGTDSYSETINIQPNSIVDAAFDNSITLFPNPNDGQFTVIVDSEKRETIQFSLYNIVGQHISTSYIQKMGTTLNHSLSYDNLAKGTYLLQIRGSEAVTARRIVVER